MSDDSCLLPPLRLRADGARFRSLCQAPDYEAALVRYPADVIHPDHQHDHAQLTFLLCGGFADNWEGRESEPIGSRHGFRPEGARHNCRFGRSGALILSVNFSPPATLCLEPGQWRPSGRHLVDLYRLLFASAASPEQVIDDLLAAISLPNEGATASLVNAPRWLQMAAEEMADDPLVEIGSIARRAGVHRGHLSRAFQKHYGVSPTQFRLHCKSALALRHMIEGKQPPGAAAVAGGFADQAHWTRASRAAAGVGPARLRRLLAA